MKKKKSVMTAEEESEEMRHEKWHDKEMGKLIKKIKKIKGKKQT
jgi:hypothetical protein